MTRGENPVWPAAFALLEKGADLRRALEELLGRCNEAHPTARATWQQIWALPFEEELQHLAHWLLEAGDGARGGRLELRLSVRTWNGRPDSCELVSSASAFPSHCLTRIALWVAASGRPGEEPWRGLLPSAAALLLRGALEQIEPRALGGREHAVEVAFDAPGCAGVVFRGARDGGWSAARAPRRKR